MTQIMTKNDENGPKRVNLTKNVQKKAKIKQKVTQIREKVDFLALDLDDFDEIGDLLGGLLDALFEAFE